jgi:hypothetical protein
MHCHDTPPSPLAHSLASVCLLDCPSAATRNSLPLFARNRCARKHECDSALPSRARCTVLSHSERSLVRSPVRSHMVGVSHRTAWAFGGGPPRVAALQRACGFALPSGNQQFINAQIPFGDAKRARRHTGSLRCCSRTIAPHHTTPHHTATPLANGTPAELCVVMCDCVWGSAGEQITDICRFTECRCDRCQTQCQ